jgi:hypothetical protein
MLRSNVVLTGLLLIRKFNEKMELVFETEIPNLVVTTGKEYIASRLISNDNAVMGYMSIGDDPAAAALNQTNLGNELSRVAVSSTLASGSATTFTATFGAGSGTGSIQEAGIFNDATDGIMFARTTFPVISKSSGETITISWIVSVG